MYDVLKRKFSGIVEKHGLGAEQVVIQAKTLTPEEAIGNPEDDDYPLLVGRERIVEARFRETAGHAFTDMFGNYQAVLDEIVAMDLKNNYRRAIFVATLNSVLGYLGLVEKTVHCKNEIPKKCSKLLVETIKEKYGTPKIALIGLQPRMAEALSKHFPLRINDLDIKNIGQEKFGVLVHGPDQTEKNVDWADLLLVTGSTAVNNTMQDFIGKKEVIFYGVTCAAPAYLLGVQRFCPLAS